MKNIAVLGSTGSIGIQTLDIVRKNKDMKISSLAAGSSIQLLEKQAREFLPEIVCVYDEKKAEDLKLRIADLDIKVVSKMEGLIEAACIRSADVVVTALVGMIGIRPTIESILAGKDIALANKETLVTAGHLIMPLVKEKGVSLLPVDSEHSAIFQALNGEDLSTVDKILLTASGGPFRGFSQEDLEHVTLDDALKHPNWSMGKKITIDSATMVNKGLEVMEARWLFDLPAEKIQVVVHKESIIHSMVQFLDGGIIAQLGSPDMKLPIQYALTYPRRRILEGEKVDFFKLKSLHFEKPDMNVFKGLSYAYEALKTGGSMPVVYNAENEKAVEKFINGEISFTGIYEVIAESLHRHVRKENPLLDEILEIKNETDQFIEDRWKK